MNVASPQDGTALHFGVSLRVYEIGGRRPTVALRDVESGPEVLVIDGPHFQWLYLPITPEHEELALRGKSLEISACADFLISRLEIVLARNQHCALFQGPM